MEFVRHEVEPPGEDALGDGDVLLRFRVGGICGSDIPRCQDGVSPDAPAPFGLSLHEIVGEVVATRSDLEVGARVVGWVGDSTGLRELVPTTASQLVEVPDRLEDTAAVALQPLACVMHAVSRLPADLTGVEVAVIGLGPVGLLFCHVLASRGARVTAVDPVDRSDVADRYRISELHHATSRTWAEDPKFTARFGLVVEVVGHQTGTLDDAIAVAAEEAHIVYFGNPDERYYPLHLGAMMDRALTLQCGRTPRDMRRRALASATAYLRANPGTLDDYVTEVVDVHHAGSAYLRASRPAVGQRKVVLQAPV
jgi:L-iditol 2-dehydrogenase